MCCKSTEATRDGLGVLALLWFDHDRVGLRSLAERVLVFSCCSTRLSIPSSAPTGLSLERVLSGVIIDWERSLSHAHLLAREKGNLIVI